MAEAVEQDKLECPALTDEGLERRAERDLERFKDLLDQIAAERQSQ